MAPRVIRLARSGAVSLPTRGEPAAQASPAHTTEPSPTPVQELLSVSGFSTERDLYIVVRDEDGRPVTGESFALMLAYPDGSGRSLRTGTDGTLYLHDLEPGRYALDLTATAAYAAPRAEVEVLDRAPAATEPAAPGDLGWREIDGQTFYLDSRGRPLTGLRQIGGKLYYFNLHGVRADALGIDVSYHNLGVNWPAVKAQGVDFVILRLGYRGWETGLLWDDVRFRQNLEGVKAAGLALGVYVYSTAVSAEEAVQEAQLVLARLGGVRLEYPVFFDIEQSGDYPQGRADRLDKVRRAETVHAFCRTIEAGGYRAGVYSGQNFLKNHIDYDSIAQYTIWLASYTKDNKLPDFDRRYDMWQFTDRGAVNGIRGLVDMNAVF